MANLSKLTLVTGGAASGKSAVAEGLVVQSGRPRVYIATAQVWDDEMRGKVNRHRDLRGPDWRTVEAPRDVASVLADCAAAEVVLLDCATMWLTNLMLDEIPWEPEAKMLLNAIATCTAPVVVVTNEVGQGIVPDNALARRFREAQGRLNQHIAAQAETVIGVMSGLPFALKGSL